MAADHRGMGQGAWRAHRQRGRCALLGGRRAQAAAPSWPMAEPPPSPPSQTRAPDLSLVVETPTSGPTSSILVACVALGALALVFVAVLVAVWSTMG